MAYLLKLTVRELSGRVWSSVCVCQVAREEGVHVRFPGVFEHGLVEIGTAVIDNLFNLEPE